MTRKSEKFQELADKAHAEDNADAHDYWQGQATSAQFVELYNELDKREEDELRNQLELWRNRKRSKYESYTGYDSDGCD